MLRLTLVLLTGLNLVLSPMSLAKGLPVLTAEEQDAITLALLQEKFRPQRDFSSDFDLYLSVRGRDPSATLLRGLHDKRYLPYSAIKNAGQSRIGRRHNILSIGVGSFFLAAPNVAKGEVRSLCGAVLCGDIKSAVMEKVDHRWKVRTFKVTMMY